MCLSCSFEIEDPDTAAVTAWTSTPESHCPAFTFYKREGIILQQSQIPIFLGKKLWPTL